MLIGRDFKPFNTDGCELVAEGEEAAAYLAKSSGFCFIIDKESGIAMTNLIPAKRFGTKEETIEWAKAKIQEIG